MMEPRTGTGTIIRTTGHSVCLTARKPFKDANQHARAVHTYNIRALGVVGSGLIGRLSNQGEKSINFYFIMVPFKKKV